MLFGEFPQHERHEDVRCFICEGELSGTVQQDGTPKGRGQYHQRCPSCKKWTWYDLKEKS